MNKKFKYNICIFIVMILLIPVIVLAEEPEQEPTPGVTPTPTPTIVEAESITLNKSTIPSLYVGETDSLVASITPNDTTDKKVTWSSSSPEVATVDENGVIKGIKAGTTTIIAKTSNNKEATCVVVVVNKEEVKKSAEALIKKLTIKNGTIEPAFKSDVNKYTVNVENTVTSLDFDLTLSTGASSMRANNNNIKTGTIVKIIVTSEDKKVTNTYEFIIKKAKSNANLKSLSIKGYPLNESFNADKTEYTVDIPYEATDVVVQASAEDSEAKVKITGANDLIVGKNTVIVTVTDTAGNEKQYKIVVTRGALEEKENTSTTSRHTSTPTLLDADSNSSNGSNNTLKYVLVTIGSLTLVLIGGVGIYFYKATSTKEKKKKTPKQPEEIKESPLIEASEKPETKSTASIMPGDLNETREFRLEDLEENKPEQKVKKEIDDLFDDE